MRVHSAAPWSMYARAPCCAHPAQIHKIIAGLVDAHELAGHSTALPMAVRMVAYHWNRTQVGGFNSFRGPVISTSVHSSVPHWIGGAAGMTVGWQDTQSKGPVVRTLLPWCGVMPMASQGRGACAVRCVPGDAWRVLPRPVRRQ